MKVSHQAAIFVGDYPFAAQLKEAISPILENYSDQQGRQSNVKATMTEWNWNPDNVQLQKFKRFILNEAEKKGCDTFPGFMATKRATMDFIDFWGNIYFKGDYTLEHDHRYSYFSMVYFLKSEWYYSPLIFTNGGKRIRPKEGRYVLFPGFLSHKVPKHRYKKSRISLAGNIKLGTGKLPL